MLEAGCVVFLKSFSLHAGNSCSRRTWGFLHTAPPNSFPFLTAWELFRWVRAVWGCGRWSKGGRKRARGCWELQSESIHLLSTCSQGVGKTCTFLKCLNLCSVVSCKGIWRACLCGTDIRCRKQKVTKKHQYHPHTRQKSTQPEACSLSPSFSATQKFSQMKSKAFPPGKPNKSHVSWTLIVSRQAQGVCQSKQVPESKDFRWELSATSPPRPGPALPSQLSLLKPRQRGLPLQWHIWQLCQERLVRCQRKKQCAFLKKADTLRRNTWNAPSSKPEWPSAHAEKRLSCYPKGEQRTGSTRLLPLQSLSTHSQWCSRHLHWKATISFCAQAHFEDVLALWISS